MQNPNFKIKDFKSNLAIVSGIDYRKSSVKLTKSISQKNILYITFNKSFPAIDEFLKSNDVSTKKIEYIDAISKSEESKDKICHYLSSPYSLTELSILTKKLISKKPRFIIFDSVTNMLTYTQKKIVTEFLLDLIKYIEKKNSNLLCYAVAGSGKDADNFVEECSTIFDNVSIYQTSQIEKKVKNNRTAKYFGLFFFSLFLIHGFIGISLNQISSNPIGTTSAFVIQEPLDGIFSGFSLNISAIFLFIELIVIIAIFTYYISNKRKIKLLDLELINE